MGMLVIYRTGLPVAEKSVLIADGSRWSRWHVNPQIEILEATGAWVRRDGCIISFAQGLAEAGHQVRMHYQFMGRRQYVEDYPREHYQMQYLFPAYFLIGFAWGKNVWDNMKRRLLDHVVPEKRLQVLEMTGERALARPWESLSLVIPV